MKVFVLMEQLLKHVVYLAILIIWMDWYMFVMTLIILNHVLIKECKGPE